MLCFSGCKMGWSRERSDRDHDGCNVAEGKVQGLVRGKDTGKSVVNFQCLQDLRWKFLHGLSRNK